MNDQILYEQFVVLCRQNDVARVRAFIKHNPDLNIHDHYDQAICRAADAGAFEVVKYLAEEEGFDVHTMGEQALRYATYEGHTKIVKYLVEKHNADPRTWNEYALCFAARNGYVDLVKYLIEDRGMSIECDQYSLLVVAVHGKSREITRYLLQKGTSEESVNSVVRDVGCRQFYEEICAEIKTEQDEHEQMQKRDVFNRNVKCLSKHSAAPLKRRPKKDLDKGRKR